MWNRYENKIRIYLIRHGMTKGNEEKRYIGVTDEGLSDRGIAELITNKYPRACSVFVSPMRRCIQTADIIYPDSPKYVIDDFREMDFGAFEGKNYQDLKDEHRYKKWLDSNGTLPFPEGESQADFKKRVIRGFCDLIKGLDIGRYDDYADISLVVHGGTIMTICEEVLGGDFYDYQIENGKYLTVDLYNCELM